jgi:hypothetical protein
MEKLSTVPTDRIPEPKNKRHLVADISLPNAPVTHGNNNEEVDYQAGMAAGQPILPQPAGIASFTKGLKHNNRGEVANPADFNSSFLNALQNCLSNVPDYGMSLSHIETIPVGITDPAKKRRRWVNPVCGLSYDSEGLDCFNRNIPSAPRIDSLENPTASNASAEMAELYWMALLRDLDFIDYEDEDIAQDAVDDLKNNFGSYNFITGWTKDASIPLTVKTLFRGTNVGDNVGPYISQFMLRGNKDEPIGRQEDDGYVKYGTTSIDQRHVVAKRGLDFMTDNNSWLEVQDGSDTNIDRLGDDDNKYFDKRPRFIRNLRDLATFVHFDVLYQAYMTACLYMLSAGLKSSDNNPYNKSDIEKQEGFGNFGGPHVVALLPEVSSRALKAQWLQKWFVHRRLRPEAFGGLIHHRKKDPNNEIYPFLQSSILGSPVLDTIFESNKEANKKLESGNPDKNKGTYFLPQAFPEGSPLHPSYGAGHATVAGACVTVLKAWFEDGLMPGEILESNPSGTRLREYTGDDKDQIRIHGELNKLAANVSIGRNAAGVHYRSDYTASLILGEEVAISVLKELKSYLPEPQKAPAEPIFSFRRFFTNALQPI